MQAEKLEYRLKILVTGGAGYIGSVVAHSLLASGHEVVIVDDLSTGYADNLPTGVKFHEISIHDVDQAFTQRDGFDGIVHLAGKIEVGESVVRPELYWQTNIVGTLNLLDFARRARISRFVFSSTCSMYDSSGMAPLTETTAVRPASPYAHSKHMVDTVLESEARAHGLAAVSLRYANAAGAVDRLGERHEPESHLIPIVLQVAAGRRPHLMLYGTDYPTPDGTCVRDYIHVSDLAAAHLLALQHAVPYQHEIYNLGNGNGFSNLEVIETARAVTGHPIPVHVADRRAGDAVVSVASSEKARTRLGWVPARPELADIIGDAWAFAKSHEIEERS
ncbi:UDP-glucose 4-epimerase [Micromonospora aurantiaca ATCC 27029]|nr:UDP-glucose 4-epimerase [Micromonospora aurantiaca ATCC 27029]